MIEEAAKKGKVRTFLGNLNIQHWGWIHFKLALGGFWAYMMLRFTPEPVAVALTYAFIPIWTVPTITGSLISLVGLMMYAQPPGRVKTLGVSIELIGLCLFVIGPLVYFITQAGLWATTGDVENRGALTAFAYAMCAVLLYRFIVVIPRFLFEARDPAKDVHEEVEPIRIQDGV